ncbi:DUF4238 domain-containing protein [Microvirga sp. 0TCS3.31]
MPHADPSGNPQEPHEIADPSHEEAVRALFEQARKVEAAHGGRKQHLVPASYLARWSVDDRVRVTEVDTRRSYIARPERVGLETDFYRLKADDLDADDLPPLALEVLLSKIEGKAKQGIDELLAEGAPSPEHGAFLAWFIALQATRGRAFRASMRAQSHEISKLQYKDLDEAGVKRLIQQNRGEATDAEVAAGMDSITKILSDEWTIVPQDAALAAMAAQIAGELVSVLLLQRRWLVYDTPAVLVTCDEPVVALAGPDGERGESGGFGDAPVILFPLSPTKLLVMLRNDLEPESQLELDHLEVADINRELVAASFRWVFEQPSRRVGRAMPVPGPPPTIEVEQVQAESQGVREVYRFYRPTRWVAAPSTAWPVSRWWVRRGYR